jgi:hypothetical protein
VARASTSRKNRTRGAAEAGPLALRFRHKPTGKEQNVSTGFAWDLFLFAGIFGLPLFRRHLPYWGAAVLALWLLVVVAGAMRLSVATETEAQLVLSAAFLALQIWLGFFGNRLTAQTLLQHGWTLDGPNDAGTRRIVERWRLA